MSRLAELFPVLRERIDRAARVEVYDWQRGLTTCMEHEPLPEHTYLRVYLDGFAVEDAEDVLRCRTGRRTGWVDTARRNQRGELLTAPDGRLLFDRRYGSVEVR